MSGCLRTVRMIGVWIPVLLGLGGCSLEQRKGSSIYIDLSRLTQTAQSQYAARLAAQGWDPNLAQALGIVAPGAVTQSSPYLMSGAGTDSPLTGGPLNPGLLSWPSAPTQLSDFDCAIVNVIGPGISSLNPREAPRPPEQWRADQVCSYTYPGIMSRSVDLKNETRVEIKLAVDRGPSRMVQVIGFTKNPSYRCDQISVPDQVGRGNQGGTSVAEHFYELGSSRIDIFSDASVEIGASFDSNRAVQCGGDGAGGGGGASRFLLIGGSTSVTAGSNPTPVATVEYFDPSPDTAQNGWHSLPDYPLAVSHAAGVTLNDGSILVAGGFTSAGVATQAAYRLAPGATTWTQVGALGSARFGHSMTLIPSTGKVLVAGGVSGYWGLTVQNPEQSFEVFDPQTGTFTQHTGIWPGPVGTAGHVALWVPERPSTCPGGKGAIVLVGGTPKVGAPIYGSNDAVNGVASIDPCTSTPQVTDLTGSPYYRNYIVNIAQAQGLVQLDGKTVTILGGKEQSGPSVYDSSTFRESDFSGSTPTSWASPIYAANLNRDRSGHRVFRYADGLYGVLGGLGNNSNPKVVEWLDLTNNWRYAETVFDSSPGVDLQIAKNGVVIPYENSGGTRGLMLFAGRKDGSSLLTGNYCINFDASMESVAVSSCGSSTYMPREDFVFLKQ